MGAQTLDLAAGAVPEAQGGDTRYTESSRFVRADDRRRAGKKLRRSLLRRMRGWLQELATTFSER